MSSELEAALHAHLTAAEDDRDRYRKALEKVAAAVARAELRLVHGGCNVPGYRGGHSVYFRDDDWFDVQAAADSLASVEEQS